MRSVQPHEQVPVAQFVGGCNSKVVGLILMPTDANLCAPEDETH